MERRNILDNVKYHGNATRLVGARRKAHLPKRRTMLGGLLKRVAGSSPAVSNNFYE